MNVAGQPLGKLIALLCLIIVIVLAVIGKIDSTFAVVLGGTDLAILLL